MDEKLGTVLIDGKEYDLDNMPKEELDKLIEQCEAKKKVLEKVAETLADN